MFVDLMQDVYHTFAERFLRAQIMFGPPPDGRTPPGGPNGPRRPGAAAPASGFDAMGVRSAAGTAGRGEAMDIGPGEQPGSVAAKTEPRIVGAGKLRSLDPAKQAAPSEWANVGRNDPCPCGSGKKFKKCHGAGA
jgi:preprotein translocase subunit SecA